MTYYTFDDVLIKPKFSYIESRRHVDLSTRFGGFEFQFPVISANMDTITGPEMSLAMSQAGGLGVLHRFCTVQENIEMYAKAPKSAISLGLNDDERAKALYDLGARLFFIDVAHGAQITVVNNFNRYAKALPEARFVVGNFATNESILEFVHHVSPDVQKPAAFKVGIGPGSVCTTRIKTGIGYPQLSAVEDCVKSVYPIIADGGMRTPGDIAKALAAGAAAVMIGGMLSGTDETPGTVVDGKKTYRGSASKESYVVQNKISDWRTAEGALVTVDAKGPVKDVLQDIEGGLRSAFSYVGASDLTAFRWRADLIRITPATRIENTAHAAK